MVRIIARSAALALVAGCLPSVPGPAPGPPETASAAAANIAPPLPRDVPGPIEIMQRSEGLEWPIVVTDEHLFTTDRIAYGGPRRIMRSPLEAQASRTEVFRGKDIRPSRAGSGFVTVARADDDVTRAAHVDPEGNVTWFGEADQIAWDESKRGVVVARPARQDGSFDIVTAPLASPTDERTLATVREPRFTGPVDGLTASSRGVAFGKRVSDPYVDPKAESRWGVFFVASDAPASSLVSEATHFFRVDFLAQDLLVTRLAHVDVGPPTPGGPTALPGVMWDNLAIDGDVVYAFVTMTAHPDATHPGSKMFAWRRGEAAVDVAIDNGMVGAIGVNREHVYWLDDTTHAIKRTRRLLGY